MKDATIVITNAKDRKAVAKVLEHIAFKIRMHERAGVGYAGGDSVYGKEKTEVIITEAKK